MNKDKVYRKAMWGSILIVLSLFVNMMVPAAFAESGITALAKYDMKTAKNLLDNSKFSLQAAVLAKDSSAPYSDVYRTDASQSAFINNIGAELGYDFVVDTWFRVVTGGERRIFSVADSGNIYTQLDFNRNYLWTALLYTHDNGDGTFTDKIISYEASDKANRNWYMKESGWNHMVFAVNSTDGVPIVYINNNRVVLVRTNDFDISEYTLKPVDSKAQFYISRTAALNNVKTNGLTYQTYGGGFGGLRFSDTVLYTGNADEETLQELAQPNGKFDVIYDMVLSQNNTDISFENLADLSENFPVYAKISNIDPGSVKDDNVYLKNIGGEKITGTVTQTGDKDIKIKFVPMPGEYTLVVENSVKNYGGSRNSDYTLNLTVNEDPKFREDLRNEINETAKNAEDAPETFLDTIKKYSEYLNISFENFDRCIGKNSVIINLAKKINENPSYEFSDIMVWFSEISAEQSNIDFADAVKLLNAEFAKLEINTESIEKLIFTDYASCFEVPEATKVLYDGLKNRDKVWSSFKNKSYDTKLENVKATIEKINEDIAASISDENKAEFYEEFNSCGLDKTEEYLEKAVKEYELKFDLNDKDYISDKDAILKQIHEISFTSENVQNKILRCMAAVLLNNVESGDRDRVGELLGKYKDCISVPEKYTSSSNKLDYHKKMIGKAYTEENIEEKLQEAIKETDTEASRRQEGGGGTSSPSNNRNNTYSGIKTGTGTTLPTTEEIRPANKDREMYIDIANVEWARAAIEDLSKKNIISGKEDGIYAPMDNVLREEMIKMTVLAFDIENTGEKVKFSDVAETDWSYEYICRAVAAGIINGISENKFGKGMSISRADAAVIISRVIEKKNLKMKTVPDITEFADYGDIPEYAKEAVTQMQKYGIMNGMDNNIFMPMGNVTRAQMAQIIYNALNNAEK